MQGTRSKALSNAYPIDISMRLLARFSASVIYAGRAKSSRLGASTRNFAFYRPKSYAIVFEKVR
jgi:hypothetical protein